MMRKTKSAHPVAATTERANEKAANSSYGDSTITPGACQWSIADFLSHGEKNAVPLRYLKKITGLDGRIIRRKIQAERLGGTPILSNNATGYFLLADDAESQRCIRSMQHRAGEIARTARAIAAATLTADSEGR